MLGILFLHHNTDEISRNNLASFRIWNPGVPIVTMSSGEAFPDGYSISQFKDYLPVWEHHIRKPGLLAKSADLLLYAWFIQRKEKCDYWLVVEWDAYCAMKVEDFIEPVRTFDISGPTIKWPNRDRDWPWFSRIRSLPPELRPFAAGIAPFCFILVHNRVLESVCQIVPWHQLGSCNGESRFATLVHACGYIPVANPMAGWNISWWPLPESTVVTCGMWHPVKWLAEKPSIDQQENCSTPENTLRKIMFREALYPST